MGQPNQWSDGTLTPEQRFWAKVNKDGPLPHPDRITDFPEMDGLCCWEWVAGGDGEGYGGFGYAGTSGRAHQVAWLFAGLELPVWPLTLDHKCRNKLCVRVDHLRSATKKQQMDNTTGRRNRLYSTHDCATCGTQFSASNSHAAYCSAACRAKRKGVCNDR